MFRLKEFRDRRGLLLVGTFGDPQAEVSMTMFAERSVCCEARTVWGRLRSRLQEVTSGVCMVRLLRPGLGGGPIPSHPHQGVPGSTRDRRPRRRRVLAVVAAAAAAVGVVGLALRDTSPLGNFTSAAAKDRFVTAYDRAMADLPPAQRTLDVRTHFGVVRVYRFAGAQPTKAPIVLLPGRASASPVWADNLPALLKLRSVYTIDLLGEPGLSIQDRPITSDADQAQWLHEVLLQLPEPRVHLVGLSIGGWTTANLLVNQPSKATSATLLDPVYVFGDMSLEAILRSIPASVRWFPKAWRDDFASWTAGGAPVKDVPVAQMIEAGMQTYALHLPAPRPDPRGPNRGHPPADLGHHGRPIPNARLRRRSRPRPPQPPAWDGSRLSRGLPRHQWRVPRRYRRRHRRLPRCS